MTYKVHPKDHTVTSNGPPKYSEMTLNEPPNDPQHDSQFTYKGPHLISNQFLNYTHLTPHGHHMHVCPSS